MTSIRTIRRAACTPAAPAPAPAPALALALALALAVALVAITAGCERRSEATVRGEVPTEEVEQRLDRYVRVPLTADLEGLDDTDRTVLGLFILACESMDAAFWEQTYGASDMLFEHLADRPQMRELSAINYGPWDRLDGNQTFVPGRPPKAPGANFYPRDLTKEEFEQALAAHPDRADALRSPYTVVYRDAQGDLAAIPYHEAYRAHVGAAAGMLRLASSLTPNVGLHFYLHHRANGLLTDEFRESDVAWLDMKTNDVDVVIGPIETYEDELLGLKTSYTCFVLVKDKAWSERLDRYAGLLADLQRGLPVPDEYKAETPGSNADLNAYDVVYYAGEANAGPKTIAINLPNDETVQLEHGTRRLQLKNAMRAKFDEIMAPIAEELIAEDQQQHVGFDAFFNNTMFHEVAHGLGVKNVIDGSGTVREALAEQASAIEEGKADVLGLYMVTELLDRGEIAEPSLLDHYVTFLASIFRSIRFGSASAHGRANLVRFDFFEEQGAFTRDAETGRYRVDAERMREAVDGLSETLLRLQGDGDYEGAGQLLETRGVKSDTLEADLARLEEAGIPVDVVWEQGFEVLGLERPDPGAIERGGVGGGRVEIQQR